MGLPDENLPILAPSCEGCGACCRHLGTPPAFFPAFALPEKLAKARARAAAGEHVLDLAIWDGMPPELQRELGEYYRGVAAGRIESLCDNGRPCFWYDAETSRCRHYEHRPETCRDFEPGNSSCLAFRREHGIDPPSGPMGPPSDA